MGARMESDTDLIPEPCARIKAFEQETKSGKLTADRALQLAELYRRSGQVGRSDGILRRNTSKAVRNPSSLPAVVRASADSVRPRQ